MVSLLIESWTWWSFVILVAASRFISRRMTLGSFRRFQADDYLMMIALCFYTTDIVTLNIVRHTNSNLLPPGYDVNTLTPQDKHERQYGSKMILVVEQSQCATIWLAKACVVLLYLRLTVMRKENIAIKVLLGYVISTFIIMDILYFGVWCQPFHNYWAVPTPNPQCDAATDHLITNAVFNLTSDIAMLVIGLPMFLRLHLPWQKKIPLIGVFSLGIFTILAAILNKVYSFSQPFGSAWTYWYCRESSTAMLVANLPFVWTFWRRCAGMKSQVGESKYQSQSPSSRRSQDEYGYDKTAEKKSNSPATADDWLSRGGSLGELEMEDGLRRQRTNNEMTLADILREPNPAAAGEKEPTPITHPQLFYGKNKEQFSGTKGSGVEKAILRDTPEKQTVRRNSDDEDLFNDTPASAASGAHPSLASAKSTGSFV